MKSEMTALKTLGLATVVFLATSCDRLFPPAPDTTLPPMDSVAAMYAESGVDGELRFSGNVLEVVVDQPADQLRRGGPLWARVGPYIYLFTPGTRDILQRYPGIAAIRTITRTNGTEVARALLVRDTLNEYSWPRVINAMSSAVTEGTARPTRMEQLVEFGEQYTQYEYNPDYVPPR